MAAEDFMEYVIRKTSFKELKNYYEVLKKDTLVAEMISYSLNTAIDYAEKKNLNYHIEREIV